MMTFKLRLILSFSFLLSFPGVAGQQEEIDKALKTYGDEVRKLAEDARGVLKETLPEVEDFFNRPSEGEGKADSFFGLRRMDETLIHPSSDSSCRQGCRSRSVEELQSPSPVSSESMSRQQKLTSPVQKPSAFQTVTSASVETLVFVSLTMPDAALKTLSEEARISGARLVMRGLLDNSFSRTSTRMRELGIDGEIDPLLFDSFKVERVPTFIRCRRSGEELMVQGHDRLSGNVPLSYALKTLKEKGELG